jgi:hypothetical protein
LLFWQSYYLYVKLFLGTATRLGAWASGVRNRRDTYLLENYVNIRLMSKKILNIF